MLEPNNNTSVSSRRRFLVVSDSSCFDTNLLTEWICIIMALITSPMFMALPSLLVRNTVLCPVFVTDMVVGGLAVLLVSADACVCVMELLMLMLMTLLALRWSLALE